MKKLVFPVVCAAAALVIMGSCNNGKKGSQTDSLAEVEEMVAEVEEVIPDTTALSTYTADFFGNEGNKGTAATDSTYAVTESGLKYVIVDEGTGRKPAATDAVTVHYTGMLTDGTVFDSSVTRGEPATFPLNRVIPGWTEGLQLMQEGGTAVFYLPSAIAYGEQGAPGAIPPNADLIFEVQLIKVN